MDDHSHSSYAPRSPDLSAVGMQPQQSHVDLWGPPQTQPLPLGASKHEPLDFLPPPSAYPPPGQHSNDWFSPAAAVPMHDPFADIPPQYQQTPLKLESKPAEPQVYKPFPGELEGTVIKTKFPVARIKRIVQADEDVGKVAQVTPVVVSKALELFMTSLALNAASVARSRGSKRVTGAHLKLAVAQDDQFDFLQDIVEKIPDPPAASSAAMRADATDADGRKGRVRKGKKKEAGSDDEGDDDMGFDEDDDDEQHHSKPKRKPKAEGARGKRKKAAVAAAATDSD